MLLEVWGYVVDSHPFGDCEIDIELVEATNMMSSGHILFERWIGEAERRGFISGLRISY